MAPDTDFFERFLSAHLSRRTLFKATGAAGAGLMLAQAGLFHSAAAAAEPVQDFLDATVTTEAFDVAFLGTGIDNIRKGNFSKPVPPVVLAVLEAARAQEQFHLDFFEQAGGRAVTTTFNLPDPALVTDYDKFFAAIVQQETRETALGIAAMGAFTELRRPDLVKVMFQYAAEEAEHRLLANYALGTRPANDRGFAQALYNTVADYVADLRRLGILGGTGPAISYPGPGEIDPTNVIERVPGGPAVDCTAPGPPAPPPTGNGGNMPGLPNTGAGGGAGGAGQQLGGLGLLALGAAAAGALALRRKGREQALATRDEEC
jgi:hypothetical protein